MRMLTLTLPDSVQIEKGEVLMMIAARLYERGALSLSQAAELAQSSTREFTENLGNYGVSVFNYNASQLSQDIKNA